MLYAEAQYRRCSLSRCHGCHGLRFALARRHETTKATKIFSWETFLAAVRLDNTIIDSFDPCSLPLCTLIDHSVLMTIRMAAKRFSEKVLRALRDFVRLRAMAKPVRLTVQRFTVRPSSGNR